MGISVSSHMKMNSPSFLPAPTESQYSVLTSVIPHISYIAVFHSLYLALANCTVHLKLLKANDKRMKINVFLSDELHGAAC